MCHAHSGRKGVRLGGGTMRTGRLASAGRCAHMDYKRAIPPARLDLGRRLAGDGRCGQPVPGEHHEPPSAQSRCGRKAGCAGCRGRNTLWGAKGSAVVQGRKADRPELFTTAQQKHRWAQTAVQARSQLGKPEVEGRWRELVALRAWAWEGPVGSVRTLELARPNAPTSRCQRGGRRGSGRAAVARRNGRRGSARPRACSTWRESVSGSGRGVEGTERSLSGGGVVRKRDAAETRVADTGRSKRTAEFVEVPGSGWGQVSVSHLRRPRPAAAAHTRASAIALCTSLRWKASIRRCLDGPSRIESTSPRRLRTSAMKDGLPSILTISEASDRK
eukprot:scaffold883_cov128-Isochrysis_galbana.AAC.3